MLGSGLARFLQTKDKTVLIAQQKVHQLLLLLPVEISLLNLLTESCPHFLCIQPLDGVQTWLLQSTFVSGIIPFLFPVQPDCAILMKLETSLVAVQEINTKNDVLLQDP